MLNFDNLEKVETANSRVNYDLRFSKATGKFTLSDEAYHKYDINNKGFNLFKDGNTPVLTVVENEEATIHKGRSDADQKGKTFTAKSLASMLGLDGEEDARYTFEEVENEGTTYILLNRMGETEEDTSITNDEGGEDDLVTNDTEEEPQVPSDNEGINEGSGAATETAEDTEDEDLGSW